MAAPKIPLAIAIGLVSAMGAAFTWHGTVLSNKAADDDRAAVRALVAARDAAAEVDSDIAAAEEAFSRARELLANAAAVEREAEGGTMERSVAVVRAAALRSEAEALSAGAGIALPEGEDELDMDALAAALRSQHPALVAPTAARDMVTADDARLRAERMALLVVAIVAAVGALTAAELSNHARRRRVLATASAVVAVVVLGAGLANW